MAHNTTKGRQTAKSRQQERAKVYDNNLGEFISHPVVDKAITAASFIPGLGIGVKGAQLGYKALKSSQNILKFLGIGRNALKTGSKVAKKVRNKVQSMAPLYVKDKGKVTVANRIIKTQHKKPQRMAQRADGTVKPLTREAIVTAGPTRRIAQIATVPAVAASAYGVSNAIQKQPEKSTEGIQQRRKPPKPKGTTLSQMKAKDMLKREKADVLLGTKRMNKDNYPIFRKSSGARANWKAKWNKTTEGGTFSYAGRKYKKKS